MTGRMNSAVMPGATSIFAFIADRLQMGQGALRRDLVVQRFGGGVPGIAMPVGLTGVLLLNASGIRQHQPAKVLRPRGAEGASGKSLGNDPGEVADVIQSERASAQRQQWIRAERETVPNSAGAAA